MHHPPIYFYIPDRVFPRELPTSADENWAGFGLGMYAWTLQTYLRLRDAGFPCQLVRELPDQGIVLVHHNAVRSHRDPRSGTHQPPIKPGKNLLLICIKAEGRRHPYAQLHVVQNPGEERKRSGNYFIPHWPQPGLIPRDSQRRDRFENIAFFGHSSRLAPELQAPAFAKTLESMGLSWQLLANDNVWSDYRGINNHWNDYSQVDAIVAVSSFDSRRTYPNKPATKLYNAWLAGVPAILGAESAYQQEGRPGENYLEVNSLTEVISALESLQHAPQSGSLQDRGFRKTLVQNGQIAAQSITPERILTRWVRFLEEVAIPACDRWQKTNRLQQQFSLEKSHFFSNLERIQDRIFSS